MRIDLSDARGAERLDSRELIEVLDADLSSFGEGDFELACAILELADVGLEDWEYGVQLIREDTFEDYARELAEDYARELADDIGAISSDAAWPNSCIDWKQAARELAMGYTTVDFLGYTYYCR